MLTVNVRSLSVYNNDFWGYVKITAVFDRSYSFGFFCVTSTRLLQKIYCKLWSSNPGDCMECRLVCTSRICSSRYSKAFDQPKSMEVTNSNNALGCGCGKNSLILVYIRSSLTHDSWIRVVSFTSLLLPFVLELPFYYFFFVNFLWFFSFVKHASWGICIRLITVWCVCWNEWLYVNLSHFRTWTIFQEFILRQPLYRPWWLSFSIISIIVCPLSWLNNPSLIYENHFPIITICYS